MLPTYIPPKSCIPSRANIRMNSNSNKMRLKIDLILFISDVTTFCIDRQNLVWKLKFYKRANSYYSKFTTADDSAKDGAMEFFSMIFCVWKNCNWFHWLISHGTQRIMVKRSCAPSLEQSPIAALEKFTNITKKHRYWKKQEKSKHYDHHQSVS